MKITKRQLRKVIREVMQLPAAKSSFNRDSRKQLREMADLDQYEADMTPEQLLTITKLLKQVDPISMRESEYGDFLTLDLGAGKKIKVWVDGEQEWFLNGMHHRADGPAAIWADGSQFWWLNGKRHRIDGPAAIYADGAQFWYQNDNLHRTDGPAANWADGTQEWYLNGKELSAS